MEKPRSGVKPNPPPDLSGVFNKYSRNEQAGELVGET